MTYEIYEILTTNLGSESITFLRKLDAIRWNTKDWDSGYLEMSFKSPEEASEKLKELFTKEKEQEWEDLNIDRHSIYTVLPIL